MPPGPRIKTHTRLRLLEGILPFTTARLPAELFAGLTLAALGIPEVLGYAKIAGMPLVTGLFTMLLPPLVFAVFCSSRHLVIGADSATAAILAASLSSIAEPASDRYVALASLSALVAGACLLGARMIRLGFIANFLSRTVLVGFLTGVGISVAASQLADMLGLHSEGEGTLGKLLSVAKAVPQLHLPTALLSLAVIVVVSTSERIAPRIPAALFAIVAAIVISRFGHLDGHQIALLGPVPHGLPRLGFPELRWADVQRVLKPSLSMLVVIVAQSSATSRSYAAKYDETFDENLDLVGLGLANLGAGLTGAFVVNGSPTKTQIVDSAGGRSQVAMLATAVVVVVVLAFLTGPLAYLPIAALASVVFLIGVSLIDLRGMRQILRVRRHEFAVALSTTCAVVLLGVEEGVILAIFASIVDHLRHSYTPHNSVLVRADNGRWHIVRPFPEARSAPGLLIFRFGSSLYYANAHNLYEQVQTFLGVQPPLSRLCLDCVAIGDIDYTAAGVLQRLHAQLERRNVRLVFTQVSRKVRRELDKYGISTLVTEQAYFEAPEDVISESMRPTPAESDVEGVIYSLRS
ncbi:MAG: SulP family inorganic anion transporter [Myxococcaceae bacterium]|nr:SulP family inorganic anion transporter [Myxococcaceae bacterium]